MPTKTAAADEAAGAIARREPGTYLNLGQSGKLLVRIPADVRAALDELHERLRRDERHPPKAGFISFVAAVGAEWIRWRRFGHAMERTAPGDIERDVDAALSRPLLREFEALNDDLHPEEGRPKPGIGEIIVWAARQGMPIVRERYRA